MRNRGIKWTLSHTEEWIGKRRQFHFLMYVDEFWFFLSIVQFFLCYFLTSWISFFCLSFSIFLPFFVTCFFRLTFFLLSASLFLPLFFTFIPLFVFFLFFLRILIILLISSLPSCYLLPSSFLFPPRLCFFFTLSQFFVLSSHVMIFPNRRFSIAFFQ